MVEQLLQEPSEAEIELPLRIRGKFLRFRERLPFAGRKMVKSVAPCSIVIGVRGSGKSSLTENLAMHYSDPLTSPERTGKILDFFGSKDCEGLAFCRSPYQNSILFIVGDSVDLACSYPYKHLSKVTLSDFRNYHVIIAVSAFFSQLKEEHHFIQTISDKLWHRTHWTKPWCLCIREAANLIYSRISLKDNQAQAKAHFLYTLREARHSGFACTCDAIRFRAVDIDLRSVADYTFFKSVGVYGLPRELRFIYRYIEPYSIMRMPVDRFILLTRRGTIAIGDFEYAKWHKTEKENLLREFDIQIDYGDMINYADDARKRVSDFEHLRIVTIRHDEGENGKPLGMDKVAKLLKRSRRTIYVQITDHNESIQTSGVCAKCKRTRSRYARIVV